MSPPWSPGRRFGQWAVEKLLDVLEHVLEMAKLDVSHHDAVLVGPPARESVKHVIDVRFDAMSCFVGGMFAFLFGPDAQSERRVRVKSDCSVDVRVVNHEIVTGV
jgi:hypothetical protein